MILQKIQTAISGYGQWLQQQKVHPAAYKWESVQHFQDHWNPGDPAPEQMFDRCFQNSETRRLWQQEHWQPKRVMLEFWKFDPATVRWMFDDLFNETKEVEGRAGRFLFGCDSLLRDFKKAKPTSIENNHYHDDYRMIALYLAFRYPEAYAPYDFPVFQQAMTYFGARDIPQQNDLPRYFKVLRTLNTFLEKEPQVRAYTLQLLHPKRHFQGKTLLPAEDLCRFVVEN